ncbi:MAG: cobalamin-dependent protein [Deltaproteobacteria bacterium]|nr:cobalamin-dependent protein [Deltaproteobacteria bacterium]
MSAEILDQLKQAILSYDAEEAERCARRVVEEKLDPLAAIAAMTAAIRSVGDGFECGDLWLPDLIGAASAMKAASPVIEDEITRAGMTRECLGSVVVGTVFGDIHDIGKNMISTLLVANGFVVHDVGVNATADQFIQAVERYQPDLLAMSSLMTMTAYEQSKVIEGLDRSGLRQGGVRVMVGGAAITESFANEIGADGYDASAPGAVNLARRLIGLEEAQESERR